jgi:hypothetical protein
MNLRKNPILSTLRAAFSALVLAATPLMAAPPDLTAGGTPDNTRTSNLGPTGMRGWIYHVNGGGRSADTSESRQILVKAVDSGSPAHGVLAVDDVILGANGTGANPAPFSSDARKSLALAIADAEARNPGTLKLLRWRSGTTTTVQITLRTLGAYSATAPYNCPKSAQILTEGAQWVFDNETSGRYSFGALSLLATGNSSYATRVRNEARARVPNATTRTQMMSDTRDATSMITWERGHTLVFLAEYYLATGDTQVLPGIEAYAVNIAKNSSIFGTVGHIFAEKNPDGSANGPMGGVYGPVNSSGMPCFLGLLLARECGLSNPEIQPAIDRASLFFASYTGRGAIPYGEHEPSYSHEGNGRSGLGALCFALQAHRTEAGKFFAKMATAAPSEREQGHTGAFFNYLWAPLGAAAGGEAAAAEHFKRISWHLDLARRWNGAFVYDCLNGEGPNSGSTYNDFRMSTATLLVYALPLRKLHITGRGHDPARWLSAADVAEAAAGDDYHLPSRTTAQLISDTGSWSPKIRRRAAIELKARGVTTAQREELQAIAADSRRPASARAGACDALGRIANSASAPVLASLLNDRQNHVRYASAEALRYLPNSARLTVLQQVLEATAQTAKPWFPVDEEDPLQFAHGRLAVLLFYGGSAYGPKGIIWNNLSGVDRNLLYPAIRAVAGSPLGFTRNNLQWTYPMLSHAETLAVSDAIVDSVREFAPSDRMFAFSVRQTGFDLLEKFSIAEGVPSGLKYMVETRAGDRTAALRTLERYAASYTTVNPVPDVIGAVTPYLNATGGNAAQNESVSIAAQDVLNAIAADTQPRTLMPLKAIQSVVADHPKLSLPNKSTLLRVTSYDHAQGDGVFTWTQLSGPGGVNFSPNGTAAAATTAVQFDGAPGIYEFKVTRSDSRGLTEADSTVTVELAAASTPLKVFILAGQSNMEGHGEMGPLGTQGTLEYLVANNPGTYGHLKTGANWTVRDDAWIWYKRGGTTLVKGGISAGYGALATTMGPELQFGHVMGNLNDGPVLIIKTAWGGKSLAVDFRPPSSGWSVNPPTAVGDQGYFYREILAHVNDVLTNLSTYFPAYNPANGYELAGFGWHQGWNDRVNQAYNDEYEVNMKNFINDIRADLGKPGLPFVIATTGMSGWSETHPRALSLMNAQLAMKNFTEYPAFEGNVAVIDTRDFWRDPAVSPAPSGNQAFHWNRHAETYFLIGQSMAQEMAALSAGEDILPPLPDPATFATLPSAISDTAVSMTATTGSDSSGPVQYLFTETTGNPGGTSSGWQTSPSYTDTGLSPLTTYTYTVTMRDSLGNTGTPSAAASVTTPATLNPPRGEITVDGTAFWRNQDTGVFTGTFDASKSDKLVVILTGEHGFNNDQGKVNSVSYDGVALTPVIQRNAQVTSTDTVYNHIWILDNPATSTGLVAVNVVNRGNVTVLGLSGTLPGAGATAISPNGTRAVNLTSTASNSLVIASFGMGGAGNTADTQNVSVDPPLTFVSAQKNGNNWDGHVTGYAKVPNMGTGTYSFTGGNVAGAYVIAAEFLAAEAPAGSPYASWAANHAPTGGPADDFDGDGVPNAIEFVLGGGQHTNDLAKLPTVAASGGSVTFTFVRDRDSVDAGVSVVIEVSRDLSTWPDVFTVGADTGSSTPGVTVTDRLDGTETITLTVPQAPDAEKFLRLKVNVAP